MKPTIGRIVLYCVDGYELAAIITRVHKDDNVDLTVFPHPWCGAYLDQAADVRVLAAVAIHSVVGEGTGATRFWKWPPRV